jgi:hypothetical protein
MLKPFEKRKFYGLGQWPRRPYSATDATQSRYPTRMTGACASSQGTALGGNGTRRVARSEAHTRYFGAPRYIRATAKTQPTAPTQACSLPLTANTQTASDAVYAKCHVVVEMKPFRTSVVRNAASWIARRCPTRPALCKKCHIESGAKPRTNCTASISRSPFISRQYYHFQPEAPSLAQKAERAAFKGRARRF